MEYINYFERRMFVAILTVMDYIGVIAFAASGAFVAIQKRMDIFGIYILAFVTAVGGGVLRDVIMDTGVPKFFTSYTTMVLVMVSTLFAIYIRNKKRWHFIITVFDMIGLAVFTVNTGLLSIDLNYHFPEFLFMSTITAVGGGVIRDLLAQRVPAILRRDIYATAAILGACVLWVAYPLAGKTISTYISLATVIIVRIASIYFKGNLPIVRQKKETIAR